MKQLFTIACTLVLGSALSFAQATQTPPAGDTTGKTSTSTTKKHHKHGGKKSKKNQEGRRHDCRPGTSPITQINCCRSLPKRPDTGPLFCASNRAFIFQLLCLKCCVTILYRIDRFQKTDTSEGD